MSAGSYVPFLVSTPRLWPPALRASITSSTTISARLGLRTPVRVSVFAGATVTARPPRRSEVVGTSTVSGQLRGAGRLVSSGITGGAVVDATVTPVAKPLGVRDLWVSEVAFSAAYSEHLVGSWIGSYQGRAEYFFNESSDASPSTFPTAYRCLNVDESTNTTNAFNGGQVSGSNRAAGDIILSGTNYGGDSQAAPIYFDVGLESLPTPSLLTPGQVSYHYYIGYSGFSATSGRTRPAINSRRLTFQLRETKTDGSIAVIGSYVAAVPSGWNVTATEDVGNDSFHVKSTITIPTTDLAKITRWDQLHYRVVFETVQPSVGTDTDVDVQLQNVNFSLPGKFIKGLRGFITGPSTVTNPDLKRQKGARPAGSATVTGDMRRGKKLAVSITGQATVQNYLPLASPRGGQARGTSSVLVRQTPSMRTSVRGIGSVAVQSLVPKPFGRRITANTAVTARISIAGYQAAFPATTLASYRFFDQNNFGASIGYFGGAKGYPIPPFSVDQSYNWGLNNAGETLAVYDAYLGTWPTGSQYDVQPLRTPPLVPENGITVFARCRTNQNTTSMYFRFQLYERTAAGDVLIGGNFNDTTGAPRYNGVLVSAGGTTPGPWTNITETIPKSALTGITDWSKVFIRIEVKSGALISGGGELDISYLYFLLPGSPNVALAATLLLPDGHFVDSNNTNVPNVAGNMTVAARRRAMAGSAAGSATASASTFKKRLAMAGHAYGVPQGYGTQTVFGDVTKTTAGGGVQRDLAGTSTGTATVVGAISRKKDLTASSAGSASTTGSLIRAGRAQAMAGTAAGSGTVAANMLRFRVVQLAASLVGVATTAAARLTVTAGSSAPRYSPRVEGETGVRVRAGRRVSR